MNKTFIVAKKELREIFSNRMNVGISIVFALFFSIYQWNQGSSLFRWITPCL